ncbi:MAG: pentapeptide repeat-containing protein [Nostoc sp.]|uniref:pentapeptide repeat-containing protein n=1 Tax=Nostoc sp. TaxID=1180 RepID=UPI002FF97012
MANEEHLALLKQGVEAWENWRRESTIMEPDLKAADLNGADLSGANLRVTKE